MMWYKLINEYGTIFWSNRRIEGHLVLEESVAAPPLEDEETNFAPNQKINK